LLVGLRLGRIVQVGPQAWLGSGEVPGLADAALPVRFAHERAMCHIGWPVFTRLTYYRCGPATRQCDAVGGRGV